MNPIKILQCVILSVLLYVLAVTGLTLLAPKHKSLPWEVTPAFAQFGGVIPLDTQLCPTVGAIAVRTTTRWQCVVPGTSGQVFKSNGAGTVPGWTTPAGTGNVNASGTPTSNQIPVWTDAVTIKGLSGGGTLLDLVTGASTTGYEKRTGAGTYTWGAIPAADLPALTGNDCSLAAGAGAISCSGMLAQAHSWSAQQTFDSGNSNTPIKIGPTAAAGTAGTINKVDMYNGQYGLGISSLQFDMVSGGGYAWWYGATKIASMNNAGVFFPSYVRPVNPLEVAYGGTGCTAASFTCLDNITGANSVGIMYRGGASTYYFFALTSLIDALPGGNGSSTPQGSILYRAATANGWSVLPPASSAGQVLASQGSGANPQWVAPGSVTPGTRVLLNTMTASNSAALQDTSSISGSYNEYEIDCDGIVPQTSGALFNLQVYQGGAYQTTGYQGVTARTNQSNATGVYAGTTYVPLSSALSTLAQNFAMQLRFSNPSLNATRFTGLETYQDNGPSNVVAQIAYRYIGGALTGFQLYMSTGNIASGACKVYGWN